MSPVMAVSESLNDWPEPVVRVQTLAESGMLSIPKEYVKPPLERPVLSRPNTATDLNLPIINMAGLGGDESTVREAVRRISDACAEWGFFQVRNHGVSPDLLRRMRRVWREFFKLPLEVKQVYANSPSTYEGYGSRLGVEKGAVLDWGDYFFLHLLPISARDVNKWPALPLSCREILEEYGRETTKLCETIFKMLSMALGLEEGRLWEAFGRDDAGACLRVNYYPKCPQPGLVLGISPHSDPGGLTLLLPDDVPGLQVRHSDSWITVQPASDAFIVNMGDQIQVLSNGKYKSVEHRVVVNSEEERLSFALFYNPKRNKLISPLPELVAHNQPPLYPAMTFEQYRTCIRTRGPKGKSQVESLKNGNGP